MMEAKYSTVLGSSQLTHTCESSLCTAQRCAMSGPGHGGQGNRQNHSRRAGDESVSSTRAGLPLTLRSLFPATNTGPGTQGGFRHAGGGAAWPASAEGDSLVIQLCRRRPGNPRQEATDCLGA